MKRISLVALVMVLFAVGASAGVSLVKSGKSHSRIIVADSTAANVKAASLLQDFVGRISDCQLPVVGATSPRKGDVVIGSATDSVVTTDGFRIASADGVLRIEGRNKGSIYAVATLLESYLGCNYWSAGEVDIHRNSTIVLPDIDLVENPTFTHRQSDCYAIGADSIYRDWHRFEYPSDLFAGRYWVHTFDKLLPASVYGKDHPEYYAWFDGERHPGSAVQWCLTNEDVFNIVVHKIDSIFKAHPDMDMISVSQNDGNYTNCTCPKCKAIDDREGCPMGSLLRFINRIADRFPDKQISTLAYLYSMHPPKYEKPRPNVNIMLCGIDCYREVAFPDNASGRDFMRALEGWSGMCHNFFVWNYGSNYDGFATPFPDFHVMQPNLQILRDHGVEMLLAGVVGVRGGDMPELRGYLISKLMWNADADVDSLMTTFLNGYYGAAGPHIERCLRLEQGALLGSGKGLWLYDSPVSHKDGMLSPYMLRMYSAIFDKAEAAVADDPTRLARVRRARLSLRYSELEIQRVNPDRDVADIERKLDIFQREARAGGLTMLNERHNTPDEYVELYRSRYLHADTANRAARCVVSFSEMPPQPYSSFALQALTDGLHGGATYKDSWVGWEDRDASITIDLGSVQPVSYFDADFLQQLGAWVLQPRSVSYSVSTDGIDFRPVGKVELAEDRTPQVKFIHTPHSLATPVDARYVRIDVEATKKCPEWHYGVGNPCWFMVDEITVR
ncbi:MAG: DUF4838 domain-containing protein [Bacteroides sp.]|nr:DUF4838 domain-containing protein [Bacteroides sp.]MCM1412980.1 DUF4838 domain-containing protein [Bacteroides sp.]MCM1471686.1 DUF4838 domain-containing protein [Bacteroides sp.]